ncbi:unnamed protein product [Ambrosiozyma monospora]|uniref:Unnamed protein product n=1 Tax=Ambrosiozyma monospora TaxID=43982 RepID=A0ACB5TL42_AMBMO|nr:unnamed protein product [Ambrosiozyma monospora]
MDLVCAMELMKNVSQFPDFINGQIPKKFRLVKVEPSPQGNRTSVPLDVFADAVREVISICKIPIEIHLSKTFFSYRDPHDSVGRLSGYLKNNVTGLSITINSAKRPSNDVPIDYLLWLRHMNHLESLSVTAYGPTMVPSAALSKVSHTLKKLSLYHYVQIDAHLPQSRLVSFPNLQSVHLEDCYLCSEYINLIPDTVTDLHVIYGSDEPTDTQVTHFKLPLSIKSFEWRSSGKLPVITNWQQINCLDLVQLNGLSLHELSETSFTNFKLPSKKLTLKFINRCITSLEKLDLRKLTRVELLELYSETAYQHYPDFNLSLLPQQDLLKFKLNIPFNKLTGTLPPSITYFEVGTMEQGNLNSLASISQHWNLHSLVISSPMGVVDLRDSTLF